MNKPASFLAAAGVVLLACATARETPLGERSTDMLDPAVEAGAPAPLCPSNACPPFHLDCNQDAADGCEVNARTDVANCGSCGHTCESGDGGAPPFTRPACLDGVCVLLCTDDPTFGPMRNCSGTDPMLGDPIKGCPTQLACDTRNCGGCGIVAPVDPLGDRLCFGGTPLPGCPNGTTKCGGSCGAQCKDLNRDPANCGACGRQCPDASIPSETVAALAAKHIVFTCSGPNPKGGLPECTPICDTTLVPPHVWRDCNGDFAQAVADPSNPAFDGCELDTFQNVSDCGACGNACVEVCHTKPSSTTLEQVCDCPPGLTWCGNECVDTRNDPHHCGSCAGECLGPWDGGNGSPVCVDSQCSYECKAGFANCNKQLPDGCEVDTKNFPDHCGSCGHRCEKDQRCGNGQCRLEDCNGGPLK